MNKKIAILGIEGAHAHSSAKMIVEGRTSGRYPDLELVGVYGDEQVEGTSAGIERIKACSGCCVFAD